MICSGGHSRESSSIVSIEPDRPGCQRIERRCSNRRIAVGAYVIPAECVSNYPEHIHLRHSHDLLPRMYHKLTPPPPRRTDPLEVKRLDQDGLPHREWPHQRRLEPPEGLGAVACPRAQGLLPTSIESFRCDCLPSMDVNENTATDVALGDPVTATDPDCGANADLLALRRRRSVVRNRRVLRPAQDEGTVELRRATERL